MSGFFQFYKLKLLLKFILAVVVVLLLIKISLNSFLLFENYSDNNSEQRFKPELETPNDWMAMQRCYPHSKIKLKSYLQGIEEAQSIHEQSNTSKFSWQSTGPTNIGGRITDIAIHPNTISTIYVGTASGGIYKSTNNGLSWVNIFTDVPAISIGDLAIDPTNQNIIYAGTGEANASSYSFFGNGIYKSIDAGVSWVHIGLDSSGYIGRIIVDSTNPSRIFIAVCGNLFSPGQHRGIFRSDDGGLNWTRKLFVNDSTSAIDIVQNPDNPNILYATMWERMRGLNYRRSFGDGSGIYYSNDGGDNWIELTSGLPSGPGIGRIGLTIARSNTSVLYAYYDNATGVEVYKTINGGMSWVRVNDGPLQGMTSGFGWYFGQIRVDPANENRVFVMGVTLFRSNDGGLNWTGVNSGIHVDHHAMYIDINSGFIYEGNDGGLYFSDDYCSSWTKINNLPITQFYAIDIDNSFPNRVYGGTQDNGTVRTLTGTITNWQYILGGDGMYCLVDYTNPDIIFAETQWGSLYKSVDGGNNFNWIASQFYSDRKNWMSPYAMNPLNPDILYFGTYRIWKTLDGGSNWLAISGDLTKGDDGSTYHTITTIDVSTVNPDIVIIGTDDGRVHITTNGGGSWAAIHSGLPDRWITRVATDPFNDSIVYATVSGFRWDEPLSNVFKSVDLGQNWTDISLGLPEIPMNCIALDPLIPDRIFVGSDAGVFYSSSGGLGWVGLSQGIPNVGITSLKIHNASRKLVAGTFGCSTYSLSLDSIVSNLSLVGTVKYKNTAGTNLNNVQVYLYDSLMNIIDSTITNYNASYSFFSLPSYTYRLNATSNNQWGGGNSTDALLVMYHFIGLDTLNGLFLGAADTDGSGVVNSSDALAIQKRFVGMIDSFPVGDWLFEKPTVNINPGLVANVDFSGLCYGDPNASYIPSIAKQDDIELEISGSVELCNNEVISLPVMSNDPMEMGALSLVFNYNGHYYAVLDVVSNLPEANFIYNILDDEIRISWYNLQPEFVKANDTLFNLILRHNNPHTQQKIPLTAKGEFCDANGVVLNDVLLYYPKIVYKKTLNQIAVSLYPNPASNYINIDINQELNESVYFDLFDKCGRMIKQTGVIRSSFRISLVDISNGVYFYRLRSRAEVLSTGKVLLIK